MLKFLTALYFCFVALFAQNSVAAPRVPESVTQNSLVYCTHATGFSFNPQTADAGTSMNVVTEQIYNKLFEMKNNSPQVEPSLAKSYQINKNGTEIRIQLRQDVQFHHTPWFTPSRNFNADDVVFSLNRVLGHNTSLPEFETVESENSQNPQYQIYLEQAKKVRFPYFDSIKLNKKIKQVEAISPYEVKITLFSPDSSVLSHLASQYAIIFSQEYALQLNADNNLNQLDNLPVGTGPYQLNHYVQNQYVRLIKNQNYWKKDAKIEHIIVDLSTENTGRLAKFLNGECHISAFPDVSQLGLLQAHGDHFHIQSTEGMNLAFLAFNFQKKSIHDIALRQAIAQGIDRKRIIEKIYYNTANLANSVIPKISWASDEFIAHKSYDYHPEQAKAFLEGKNLTLTMWVMTENQVYNPAPLKMAELIRADLAKVGIDVKVRSVTRNYMIEQLKNQTEEYDMILTGWLTGNLDPDSFMRPILSCSTQFDITNLANWCYRPLEYVLDQALNTEDPFLRSYEYKEAQKMLMNQLPIIPIAHVKRILVANNQVKGLEMTPFGNIRFEKLSIKKGEKK
ncbi:MAG: ABC transporter substrate-binding protein [Lonepinella koalarum]|nr:ABC transporter substrate-binding protein [Lonepinella koalarum]